MVLTQTSLKIPKLFFFVNDSLYDTAAYATKTAVKVDQFSSAESLDRLGHRGYTRDDSTEILFQSVLQDV